MTGKTMVTGRAASLASLVVVPDRFRRIALAVSAWCALMCVVSTIVVLAHGDRVRDFGWTPTRQADGAYTLKVAPRGRAAGVLRTGDVLEALNGDPRVARWATGASRALIRGDAPYTITVRREGRDLTYTLVPASARSAREFRLSLGLLIDGLVWCALVTAIALFRADLSVARLAFAAGVTMGLFFLRQAAEVAAVWDAYAVRVLVWAIFPVWPMHLAFGYDFYVRFPLNVAPPPVLLRMRAALYLACGVVAARSLVEFILFAIGPGAYSVGRAVMAPLDPWTTWTATLAQLVTGFAVLAAMTYKYRHVQHGDDRRRLRWIVWGTVAGVIPFIVISVGRALVPFVPWFDAVLEWGVAANIAIVVIPLALGYAIVRHQVFDITVVIRRGVRYLLAKNALRFGLLLPLGALSYGIVAHRDQPIADLVAKNSLYIFWAVATVAGLALRTRLAKWVDRRFFREAYDRERILVDLLDDVAVLESATGVSKLVSRELEAAFHPQCLFIWYRSGARPHLALAYSSGGHIYRTELDPVAPLVRLVEAANGVVQVRANAAVAALPAEDRTWLNETRVELMVPISGQDRQVIGLLMLGDKKSDEPYSSEDRRLLEALARQIALARENVRLQDRVDEDRRVRHEVLSRLDGRLNLVRQCPICGACYDAGSSVCAADGAELALSLPIERTIDGKYRLDRLIGKGGMGAVYEATDLRLNRQVAVKVLLGRTFGDRQSLRRFEREAQAAGRLTHPNIVAVYDFGAVGAEGAFLVMEMVRGRTLRCELQRRGACPPPLVASWTAGIGAAVGAAHAQGIVHRDIKPENVILATGPGESGTVKVVDFGLAKMLQNVEGEKTTMVSEAGVVLGTAGYMAPEQLAGGRIDGRTDIFALGVLVAESVTGARPFTGRTIGEIFVAISRQPLRLPGTGPGWRQLEAVLQRAVAEEPEDRYPAVNAFLDDVVPALNALAPAV